MRVIIKEHFETIVLLCLLHNCLSCCPDRWVVDFRGVQVHPIQVASLRVKSIVATRDTIWVEHHDNLEDETFAEAFALLTSQIT